MGRLFFVVVMTYLRPFDPILCTSEILGSKSAFMMLLSFSQNTSNSVTPLMHNDYVKGYPNPRPIEPKEAPIITNHMTEEQSTWLTVFADELGKRVKNFKDGDDIRQEQVLNVLWQIKKYIERYPNPRDAAKAMSYTGSINHGRDEAIERGEGVRRNRYVGQFPTRLNDDGEEVAIDLVDRNAIDPETQAADRDECLRAVVVGLDVENARPGGEGVLRIEYCVGSVCWLHICFHLRR